MSPWKKKPWKTTKRRSLIINLFFFGLMNFLWLIFRTGSKPSRITYPCQQAAANNLSISLNSLIPVPITAAFLKAKTFVSNNKDMVLAIPIIVVIGGGALSAGFFWNQSYNSYQEVQLSPESKKATVFPASDIYIVNGQIDAHINKLLKLMSSHGLFFYKSGVVGENQGSEGLIASNDVVLLKINSQWSERGGTNTDVLKELIQTIVDHPDGFLGEIVVADNGQGFGSLNWDLSNAEKSKQSTLDVVNMFKAYNISTYDWQPIRSRQVAEYADGDMTSGYIRYNTSDPETGIYVTYPKFRTAFGTYISFKHGIWNGTGYEKRLKVINMPILKSHSVYGVTASIKNYMGVQSEGRFTGLGNGHSTVGTGGMGTLLVETGLPTLNILDAIWVNAIPKSGPSTSYTQATRVDVLMAGVDPIALDYWAAKHILVPTAQLIGYEDTHTLDPTNAERSGLEEAFGVYLNLTKDEIVRGGYDVTSNEDRMNVYVYQEPTTLTNTTSVTTFSNTTGTRTFTSTTSSTSGFGVVCVVLGLVVMVSLILRRRRKGPT